MVNEAIHRIESSYDDTNTEARLAIWVDDLDSCTKEDYETVLVSLISVHCARVLLSSEFRALDQFRSGRFRIPFSFFAVFFSVSCYSFRFSQCAEFLPA
jgi:hypothetical protein